MLETELQPVIPTDLNGETSIVDKEELVNLFFVAVSLQLLYS